MTDRVLFLCTGNSARSIIAEALLQSLGGDNFDVHSAGTQPKGIHPLTIRVLTDASISTAGLRSTPVDGYLEERFDYVITLCDDAAEQCPVFPGGVTRLHWSLPDPAAVAGTDAERLDAFRRTLSSLHSRVEHFIDTASQR